MEERSDVRLLSTTLSSVTSTVAKRLATWSNWSEWSPCRGVNRDCDPGRIHSRIRKCIGENGDVVNSDICRISDSEQQELEIRDCRCDHSQDLSQYKVNLTNITDYSTSSSHLEKRKYGCHSARS